MPSGELPSDRNPSNPDRITWDQDTRPGGSRPGRSLTPRAPYKLFAKLKTLLRKAATRSRDDLWAAIGNLLDAFSPDECRNYLVNCGYALE